MAGCGCDASRAAAGGGLVLTGLGFLGVGLWARREVQRGLRRERIADGTAVVASARAARALAEVIREQTLESTAGRTYAETAEYLAADGSTTADAASALLDERTGQPVRNPDVDLWIRSTTLQTALMQAYLAFRLADLMAGLGGAFVVTGAALATGRKR